MGNFVDICWPSILFLLNDLGDEIHTFCLRLIAIVMLPFLHIWISTLPHLNCIFSSFGGQDPSTLDYGDSVLDEAIRRTFAHHYEGCK